MTAWATTQAGTATRRPAARAGSCARALSTRRAYTLIEVLVVAAIISILLVMAGVSWQQLSSSEREAQAINTLVSYASVARTYAMQYQIETILAIEPNQPSYSLHLYAHDIRSDGWMPGNFLAVRSNLDELPKGLAAAPANSANLDAAGNAWDSWVAICFDSSGRLKARQVNSWGRLPLMGTSYGVKVYRPERLIRYTDDHRGGASITQLDQVRASDFANFLNEYTETGLWEAAVLNQWSAQPLPME